MNFIVLNQAEKVTVEAGNPYLSGAHLRPVQRQGGSNGNPDPCFILNAVVLTEPAFSTVHPYLSGLPVKNASDSDFASPLPEGE